MSEREPQAIFDEEQRKRVIRRVGLELDDEQLSQVPNPQVEPELEPSKSARRKLGSFWEDRY